MQYLRANHGALGMGIAYFCRVKIINTDQEADIALLFRKAEIRAERLVAVLRMVIAIGLAIAFAVSMAGEDPDRASVMAPQLLYAGGTMTAYFTLGLVSWLANQRGVYQPWMAWPSATADCLFLLMATWLGMVHGNQTGAQIFSFPSVWLVPLVMTFGTLRFNPWLQAYITVILLSGLAILGQMSPLPTMAPSGMASGGMGSSMFYYDPANFMRFTMLGMAGLVLVAASVRTRAVLLRSIKETRQRENLTHYLPAQLAPMLAKGGLEELRRGKRHQMGVLFIDMRGFTSWSENRSPQEISEFMTEFRRRISGVARKTGGIIDKFMGDAAMIVFGGESDPQIAAMACVTCAEQLGREMSEWSSERVGLGETEVRVGIGLHWGEVFSGVVGDQDRLEYSVFGDTVNIAARLEEMTKTFGVGIVASKEILEQANTGAAPKGWTALESVQVRGRTGKVEVLGRSVE